MNATIGRIVHYKLSEADAEQINQRRPQERVDGAGMVVHTGNWAEAGEVYPAMVVRTFGGSSVNLQVMLDGNDTYWATSRSEGDEPGTWSWPARV